MVYRDKEFAKPPLWTESRLDSDRMRAVEEFREERIKEPLEQYLEWFEVYRDVFENLLELTVDLSRLTDHGLAVLTDQKLCEAFRYLAAPPVSLDDLKILAQASSMSAKVLRANPDVAQRIVNTVLIGLDRRRFPWLTEQRDATERERDSAILASAALIASRRVETDRRNDGKSQQESRVREILLSIGFTEVPTRPVWTLDDAPAPGQFCRETMLATRKADVIVRLWDKRVMPIECKVSNSATNSIKRLNNDAAVKAESWRKDLGATQVVPAAVLGGVFNLRNLEDAQQRGLTLFWEHDLGALTDWITQTKIS